MCDTPQVLLLLSVCDTASIFFYRMRLQQVSMHPDLGQVCYGNNADGKLVETPDPGQTSEEVRSQVPTRLSDVQVCC